MEAPSTAIPPDNDATSGRGLLVDGYFGEAGRSPGWPQHQNYPSQNGSATEPPGCGLEGGVPYAADGDANAPRGETAQSKAVERAVGSMITKFDFRVFSSEPLMRCAVAL